MGTIALTGALALAGLLVVGCASTPSSEPSSLTGRNAEQERIERMRYTDEKGRYHPELQSAGIPLHQVASE